MHRLQVRAAHTETVGDRAITVWTVLPSYGEAPPLERLRDDVRRALDGTLDVTARLASREAAYDRLDRTPAPRVEFVPGASERATVLEVRAHDAPGLLHRVGRALASAGAAITAARVSTLGSDVVDVFYLVGPDGGPLSEDRAAAVRVTVLAALDAAGG
jgi:[protein-PII] uridylyltransferase